MFISSSVNPRGQIANSIIAKSDPGIFHGLSEFFGLINKLVLPPPPVLVPTLIPFTNFKFEPELVPHITTQFVSGTT